jgi:hypothetical protein
MHEAKKELGDLLKEEQLKGAALVVLANKQASLSCTCVRA